MPGIGRIRCYNTGAACKSLLQGELLVNFRTFQRGDEAAQVAIYNEAAGTLPRFKPASLPEVQRRALADDFDASLRFYAIVDGQPVAYAVGNRNGRVRFPWCRKGHEALAEP